MVALHDFYIKFRQLKTTAVYLIRIKPLAMEAEIYTTTVVIFE
jgi:hypothetical protein